MDVTNNLSINQLYIPPETSTAGFGNTDPNVGLQVPRGDWVTNESVSGNVTSNFRRQGQEIKDRARAQTLEARRKGEIGPRDNIIPTVVYYDAVGRDEFGLVGDGRDFSAGGARDIAQYKANLKAFMEGLGDTQVELVIEPDSLAGAAVAEGRIKTTKNGGVTLTSASEKAILRKRAESIPGKTGDQLISEEAVRTRNIRNELVESVKTAVDEFSKNPNATIYVDAGNNRFTPANDNKRFTFLAQTLVDLGIATDKVAGFSTNVSNFESFGDEEGYGDQLRKKIQELAPGRVPDSQIRQIIDTSRNGVFVDLTGEGAPVFNRAEAAFGRLPGDIEGNNLVSARWVKNPAESDGDSVPNGRNVAVPLNGALGDNYRYPPAGTFNEAYLLQLFVNTPETADDVKASDTRRGFISATQEELLSLIPEEFRDNVIPAPGSEETAAAFTPRAPKDDEPNPPETIIIRDRSITSKL